MPHVRSLERVPLHRSLLALAAILAMVAALLAPSPAVADDGDASDVRIVEMSTRGPAGASDNFIRIRNEGAGAVDVSGWDIQRCNNTGSGFTGTQVLIAPGTVLAPGADFLVAKDPEYSGVRVPDATYSVSIADNGGARLLDADGVVIDGVGFGTNANNCTQGAPAAQLTTAEGSEGLSHQRVSDTGDNATDFVKAPRTVDAPAGPANVLANPSFEAPGTVGIAPIGWSPRSFENEGTPFNQDVSQRRIGGQFPPPGPVPDGDWTVQVFWQSSSSLGVKGFGFEQPAASFLAAEDVDASNVTDFSYAIALTAPVNASVTTWAGAIAELELATPEGTEFVRYFHPNPASEGAPVDTGDTTYLVDAPLQQGAWVAASHDLTQDLAAIADTFTVTAVRFASIFERDSAASFANQTIYVDDAQLRANVAIDDAPPAPVECTPDADITRIHEVQGAGASSPIVGQVVTIDAVVTLAEQNLGGFFVQEAPENVDDDPLTSEGLFISSPSIPDGVEPHISVQATGVVAENFGRTQLNGASVAVCGDVEPIVIEPVDLPLPSSPAEREPFENMLVTASDLVVSGSFAAWEFGELVTGFQGELPSATEVAPPGPLAEQAAVEIKAREVILDDRSTAALRSRSIWDQDPERRLGDRIPTVTGVLDFSFGDFKIQYTEFPEFELFGAPEVPRLVEGNDIAAFNVLNYFNEFGNSSRLRGAQNQAQFELQTAKIVETILELDATVLGLIELQNDYLDEFDGNPDTEPSVATLVRALNEAAGESRYDYVRMPQELLATEGLNGGGVGTDAIANGIIYQPDRATQVGEASTFNIDNGISGDGDKNRWPFAASFELDGELVTVAVNHFKSKGSGCQNVIGPDFDAGDDVTTDLTGSCDLTRQYAANELVNWIGTDPTGAGTDQIFLVGDFNSYAQEAPIQLMKDAGYVNVVEDFADGAFSYKFSGRVGTLDYIMASEAVVDRIADAAVWQVNSRASYVDLYDVADDTTVASGNLVKGSSDHDPLVVSLRPAPPVPTSIGDCQRGGWRDFTDPGFANQGRCVSFVVSSGAARHPAGAGVGGPPGSAGPPGLR